MTHPTDPPTVPNDAIETVRGDVREVRMGPSPSSGGGLRNAVIVVVAIVAVALAWLFWKQLFAPVVKPVAQVPVEAPKVAVAPPPAAVDEAPKHPIEAAPAVKAEPLPALADSDRATTQALVTLLGADAVLRYAVPQELVRRIVATVDNLPRKTYAQRLSPLMPAAGAFVIDGRDASMKIGAANARRYAGMVNLLEAVDAKALVAAYVRFYPLFQEAYRELGYPKGHFNDRLVEALDLMIATREPGGPIALVQPKVLYQYANPEWEALPAGQKVMLRMGPENEKRVKAKLREIRALVARDGAAAKEAAAAPK